MAEIVCQDVKERHTTAGVISQSLPAVYTSRCPVLGQVVCSYLQGNWAVGRVCSSSRQVTNSNACLAPAQTADLQVNGCGYS